MSAWRATTFGDVAELQRGHDLPAGERVAGSVPIIGSFGVTGSHDIHRYPGPGVAIGRSGAAIGKATLVDGPFWPLNTCLFVKDFKGNDPRWVYWLLKTTEFSQFNSGSAQPSLNRNFLTDIPVSLPPVSEQRAIAELLGALDDKITANARVARIAGEVARTLFSYELRGARIYQVPFKEIAAIGGGGTPRTGEPDFWNGSIPWATPTDITALSGPYLEKTERMITVVGLSACSSPLYPAGSILMTSRATIGAFAIAGQPTAVNQGFIVVNPLDDMIRWWVFHDMMSRVDEFVSHANGATFMELSRGRFKELSGRLADTHTMRAFGERAAALHDAARQGLRESVVLAELRDTLLPRLMSGRLRVRDAEQQIEAAV